MALLVENPSITGSSYNIGWENRFLIIARANIELKASNDMVFNCSLAKNSLKVHDDTTFNCPLESAG